MAYTDLEIGLHRRNVDYYEVELRISRPDSDAEIRPSQDGPQLVQLDLQRLRSLELDDIAYGQVLSQNLFRDERLRQAFAEARTASQSRDQALRLRLFIGPSAPELHDLHWEKLRDPDQDASLVMNQQILFSRYLSSFDWRPVCLRPQAKLKALVLIANPADIAEFQPGGRVLAPLDVPRELAQAKAGLGTILVKDLPSGGQATVENLCAQLRNGCDLLYLVCHGALIEGEPWLWLENDQGFAARVSGRELVDRLRNLPQRPRLVVLASCQSAGNGLGGTRGAGGALAGLGPRLAEAGIPAVLAMQGEITVETVSRFMPVFFEELQRDGQIDQAMAVARNAVRNRPDWWMPVLFMRLKSGRLWYSPGFTEEQQSLETWPVLLQQIELGKCTPVLGPGLNEAIWGCSREIAQRWAETWHFPLAPYQKDYLPQVAQYLAIKQAPVYPRDDLQTQLRCELAQRCYGGALPEDLQRAPLTTVLSEVGEQLWHNNPSEPHAVLASLPLPLYITATPDNLLTKALRVAGKDPQVEICPWNDDLALLPSVFDKKRKPPYKPSVQQPLVYHLFGRFKEPDSEEPESLVLTEDDYFDYLIGVTKNRALIPECIRSAMTNSVLLFLGFQIDDWDFRVLFRNLMSQEGGKKRRDYPHVAVQIDPEAGRLIDPKRARQYLEKYFGDARIGIYWGGTEDFVRELQERRQGGTP
jgi:hypothetical protein